MSIIKIKLVYNKNYLMFNRKICIIYLFNYNIYLRYMIIKTYQEIIKENNILINILMIEPNKKFNIEKLIIFKIIHLINKMFSRY